MRFSLRPSAVNDRGPACVESLLGLMHRADVHEQGMELAIRTSNGAVGLEAECAVEFQSLFREAALDLFPGSIIAATAKAPPPPGLELWTASPRWSPDVFPIPSLPQQDAVSGLFADPLAFVLTALRTGKSGRIECDLRLRLRPAGKRRIAEAKKIAERCANVRWRSRYAKWACDTRRALRLLARPLAWIRRTEARPEQLARFSEPMFEASLAIEIRAAPAAVEIVMRKHREILAALNQFRTRDARFISGRLRRGGERRHGRGFLLTAKEAAELWHPLISDGVSPPRLERAAIKELEPPLQLPTSSRYPDVTTLGRVVHRRQRDQFGIHIDDLRRHLIAVGKTGCGKSTFLANVVRQQMDAGRGVILIDPHGQLVEEVLDFVPKRRTNDVILFDAGDRQFTTGFNPLIGPPGSDATLIADGVLTAFKNVFGFDEGSAPRLMHIFRNCLLALVGRDDASLIAVRRLLVDPIYRKSVIAQVSNPAVRDFWRTEFAQWSERDRTQYIASLQNKLGAFTTNERLQGILGATTKGIRLRTIIDQSQILLCNLSKGTVGHDASTLLGSLLLSSLHVAAVSRADVPEDERRDSVAVIDEFHSYLADGNSTMENALAESRKYRVSYVLATQMLEQLDRATLAGVLGNCGSTLCMTVGPRDAEALVGLLGHGLTTEELMRLPKYQAYLRLLIDGEARTFLMTTIPPPRATRQRKEAVRHASRERYSHCNCETIPRQDDQI